MHTLPTPKRTSLLVCAANDTHGEANTHAHMLHVQTARKQAGITAAAGIHSG